MNNNLDSFGGRPWPHVPLPSKHSDPSQPDSLAKKLKLGDLINEIESHEKVLERLSFWDRIVSLFFIDDNKQKVDYNPILAETEKAIENKITTLLKELCQLRDDLVLAHGLDENNLYAKEWRKLEPQVRKIHMLLKGTLIAANAKIEGSQDDIYSKIHKYSGTKLFSFSNLIDEIDYRIKEFEKKMVR